jgi:pimeloyl-ACP methyl ester carboxylesterase
VTRPARRLPFRLGRLGLFFATVLALALPSRAFRQPSRAQPSRAQPSRAQPQASQPAVVWSGTVELPAEMKLDFSVELAKDSGTISIPLQHAKDIPLDGVEVTAKSLKFAVSSSGAAWELAVADDGKSATGVLRQGGGEFKTTMRKLAAGETVAKELVRPQEPKPPFPYATTEVAFENAAGHAKLAGTLSVPSGDGPFPCVVMVTGSGPQDRDESLLGHRPFLVIADHLSRHGIAVLRYDDRGTAKSTGEFKGATSDDFADDALAAVAFLKTRKEIDPRKTGILGHSEGGLVAPICAAKSKDVAFIVLLAGTGMTGAELMPIQAKLVAAAIGRPADEAELEAKDTADVFAMVLAGKSDADVKARIRVAVERAVKANPETKDLDADAMKKKVDQATEMQSSELLGAWFKRFLVLDPRENLRKVTCPVLAVNGSLDVQVPAKENLPRIEKALKEGGNKDVTVVEFPGLNHLFQTCKTGGPTEYGEIAETISPKVLETVTGWIRRRTGLE